MKQVTIAGMGPGSAGCMTQEVCRAVKQAPIPRNVQKIRGKIAQRRR